jgi:hypothetical protein
MFMVRPRYGASLETQPREPRWLITRPSPPPTYPPISPSERNRSSCCRVDDPVHHAPGILILDHVRGEPLVELEALAEEHVARHEAARAVALGLEHLGQGGLRGEGSSNADEAGHQEAWHDHSESTRSGGAIEGLA